MIALGFTYEGDAGRFMPGVIVDLYRAYDFCRKSNALCYVLTDMVDHPQELHDFNLQNDMGADFNYFTPGRHHDRLPNVTFHRVRALHEMAEVLSDIDLSQETRILFYYSGHGTMDKNVVMPSGEMLEYHQMRDAILDRCDKETEILMLVDCCHAGGWSLPYKLDLSRKTFRLCDLSYPVVPPVILISSNDADEKAVVSRRGSLFTKYLFHLLSMRKTADLSALVRNIQHEVRRNIFGTVDPGFASTLASQSVSAYASYPVTAVMWSWVVCQKAVFIPNPTYACLLVEMPDEIAQLN